MRPANNQLEIHHKILDNVKDSLAPFVDTLLKAPEEKHFIGGYVCFWIHDMRKDLEKIRELHRVEGVHSKTVIFEMKYHFLDYVATCDNVHNPIVAPVILKIQEASIYSDDEGACPVVMSER